MLRLVCSRATCIALIKTIRWEADDWQLILGWIANIPLFSFICFFFFSLFAFEAGTVIHDTT